MDFDISKLVHEARQTLNIDDRWAAMGEDGAQPDAIITVRGDGSVGLAKDVTDLLTSLRPRPRARAGVAGFSELASFIAHVKRNRGKESVVFANTHEFRLEAIYDYHQAGPPTAYVVSHEGKDAVEVARGEPAWLRHRALYTCPRSRQWATWIAKDGVAMSQAEFGDFLEQNLDDLTSEEGFPPPAAVLDMARNLQIYTNGTFERKLDPTSGTYTLVAKEEHATNSTRIPRAFALVLPVFEAGQPYLIEARMRFAMEGGRPRFAFSLHNRAKVEQDAFGAVRAKVASETDLPVYAGSCE